MIIKIIVTSRQLYGGVRESSAFEKFNTHLAFMMMLNAHSSEFQTSISNLKQNLNTLDVRELSEPELPTLERKCSFCYTLKRGKNTAD